MYKNILLGPSLLQSAFLRMYRRERRNPKRNGRAVCPPSNNQLPTPAEGLISWPTAMNGAHTLWGIGLFAKTHGSPFYLHDRRARTLTEAILWHGGEAQQAKTAFTHLSKDARDALLKFLSSL